MINGKLCIFLNLKVFVADFKIIFVKIVEKIHMFLKLENIFFFIRCFIIVILFRLVKNTQTGEDLAIKLEPTNAKERYSKHFIYCRIYI